MIGNTATRDAIYRSHEDNASRRRSSRLGASILGHECDRYLWLSFRWTFPAERFDGRTLRLFETGHIEEARILAELEAIGVELCKTETGEQWEESAGHIVCRPDGIGRGFLEAPKAWHIVEIKTHNRKSFEQLEKSGVRVSKPTHYCQCMLGMGLFGIDRAMYIAECKDNSALYTERLDFVQSEYDDLMQRGKWIVGLAEPPGGIGDTPAFWGCKFCPTSDVCHGVRFPQANCRTCCHSTPVDDGSWRCDRRKETLSLDRQAAGCGDHLFIPGMIHGDVVDASETEVTYRIFDGSLICNCSVNGFPAAGGDEISAILTSEKMEGKVYADIT